MPYQATLYRAVHTATLYGFQRTGRYRPRPLYSLGAPAAGARFTPRGGAPALYLAEDQGTALHEYHQVGLGADLKPSVDMGALSLFNVEVQLNSVLDLTKPSVQGAIGTTVEELASPWRYLRSGRTPPTHVLGAATAASGLFEAIRFPSAKGPGACLAIFTTLLASPAYVRIRDPGAKLVEKLP